MQIACQRFSCQKAVEVCYWSCKFRRGCKDWQRALAGAPGLISIQSRLEAAAAKTGRAFDPQTLTSPARKVKAHSPLTKEAAAARVSVVSRPALTVQSNLGTRSDVAMLSRAQTAASSTTEANPNKKPVRQKANKANYEMSESPKETMPKEMLKETTNEKPAKPKKAAPKPARPKPAGNGTIYLLLSKNGKYKELREAELLKQAATLLTNPALRLVKGQLLVPTISFQAAEE